MITHTCNEHSTLISWQAYQHEPKCPICVDTVSSEELEDAQDDLKACKEQLEGIHEDIDSLANDLNNAVLKDYDHETIADQLSDIWTNNEGN